MVFRSRDLKGHRRDQDEPATDSIIYDPASKHIVTFNGDSNRHERYRPGKADRGEDLPVGGGVEQPVADGKGMIYDNNLEKNEVVVIESRDIAVKARWPVAPAGMPFAIAMDRKNRRLFSAGRDPQMLVMMDADKGNVIQSFSITAGVDALELILERVWCSPRHARA